MKIVVDRRLADNSRILSATISKNQAGQYFASICVETAIAAKPKTHKSTGVDVGIKELATLSDGIVLYNPRFLKKHLPKLKRLQQYLSRKQKGSRRWHKCRWKIARLHNTIANQRLGHLHHCTTQLVNHYDKIVLEDLNVSGMLKNHKLAGAIADVSWAEFRRLLTYKCEWYGKELVLIDRFAPTSKTCSKCGWKNTNLTLKDRIFTCAVCQLSMDRDWNAAKNIHALGVNSA